MAKDGWVEWSQHVLAELKRLDQNHNRIIDKIDQIDEKFCEYNTLLTRNTVSLEDHVRRTNLLETKVEHVESEVDGLKNHIDSIHPATALLKLVGSKHAKLIVKALVAAGTFVVSYLYGLKSVIQSWFQ